MRITSSQVAVTATHLQATSQERRDRLAVSPVDARRGSSEADESRADWAREAHRHEGPHGHRHSHRHRGGEGRGDDGDGADVGSSDQHAVDLLLAFRAFVRSLTDASGAGAGSTDAAVTDATATTTTPKPADGNTSDNGAVTTQGGDATTQPAQPQQKWHVVYDQRTVRREVERTGFAAAGTVTTADGRTINFATASVQQRAEVEKSHLHLAFDVTAGANAAVGDKPAVPTTDKPTIDKPAPTSRLVLDGSYLALDGSGDGETKSAGGFLGATSGNAFSDLAALDDDHNGWIDEADAAWSHLRLLPPTLSNNDESSDNTLTAAGVGAIALANLATPFNFKYNNTPAEQTASGVFLHENGDVGVLQQINLTV